MNKINIWLLKKIRRKMDADPVFAKDYLAKMTARGLTWDGLPLPHYPGALVS